LLFEFLSAKKALLQRIQNEPSFEFIRSYFLAKSLEELYQESFENWLDLDGVERQFFI